MFTCDNNLALEHVLRGGNSDFSLEVMFKKLIFELDIVRVEEVVDVGKKTGKRGTWKVL